MYVFIIKMIFLGAFDILVLGLALDKINSRTFSFEMVKYWFNLANYVFTLNMQRVFHWRTHGSLAHEQYQKAWAEESCNIK